jgi:ribonuclease inhibitor
MKALNYYTEMNKMKKIIIDGKEMKSRKEAHLHIKEQLQSTEYYGNNLDALWDALTSYTSPIEICLINKEELIENLGEYGSSLIQVFKDAATSNSNISFEIIEEK